MRFSPLFGKSRAQVVLFMLCSTLTCVAVVRNVGAEDESSSQLSMERIYASGEFAERGVNLKWAPTGSSFLKREKSPNGDYQDVVFESLDGEKTVVVSGEELIPKDGESQRPIGVDSFEISRDANLVLIYSNSRRVWRQNTRGDYWIRDRKNDVFRKLGGDFATPSSLQFAKFSPDGTRVAYVFKNNLYVEEIVSGRITQLTRDGTTDVINGTFDWVYEEEFYCRDGFRWSPDGKKIAFWRLDSSREPEFVMLDDVGLSTVSGATRIEVSQINGDFQDASIRQLTAEANEKGNADATNEALKSYPSLVAFKYPRVGCENAEVSIGVVSLPELGEEDFNCEENARFINFNDPEEYYLPGMEWYDGSLGLIVLKTPRSQRECSYYRINPETLEPTLLFSESDPDGAWQSVYPLYPLADGERFLRVSERSGYRSYYLASCDQVGEEGQKPFTLENADAIDFVSFDYDENGAERGVYYYASPENATQRFLYYATFDGENRRVYSSDTAEAENRTSDRGFETWSISADAKWGICRRSAFGVPTTIELVKLEKGVGTVEKVLQDNAELKEKLANANLGAFEFFTVEIDEKCDFEKDDAASDKPKQKIDGWAIFPPDWDDNSDKQYPVLVYVYGEPAGQTVVDSWGGSTYLYHQAIAQRGCLVLSFDVRGTPAPKGRAWRKRVYQKFGAVGRSDQANALRAFLKSFRSPQKIDLARVGVWGWSGGGTSTLNLMFNYPDLYTCGVAIAPVPDYRNYDTIYQERYSGLITETPESYELGSPIGYARQLQGRLLIIHGSGDDNCHFQTTEKLINELIACGKDFETFVYPFRSHGIFEGNGTTLHLRKKTMKFWETNLLVP